MPSSGPRYPGTVANDATIGSDAWTNLSGVQTPSDGQSAELFNLNSGDISQYLKTTNFGFAIPAGSTIDGIYVETYQYFGDGTRTKDYIYKLVHPTNGIAGDNKAQSGFHDGNGQVNWNYGGSADLWGQTWTADDINNSAFGFVMSLYNVGSGADICTCEYIRMYVYYTAAATGQPTSKRMGGVALAYGGYQPGSHSRRWRHNKNGLILPEPGL